MPHAVRLLTLVLFGLSCATPSHSPSQPAPEPAPLLGPGEPNAEEPHSEGHGAGSQGLSVFIGSTTEFLDSEGLTVGLDYEYRLSHKWGVGGFAEGISGLDRSFAVGAQGYWHVAGELVLVAGPGAERRHEEWEPIVRVGGFYEFPLGAGWMIAPAIFYDITPEQDIFIYGVNLDYIW